MASAKVSVLNRGPASEMHTEMVIVGGGICGILAAKMCTDREIPYKLIERERMLGGNWHSLANSTSYLQVIQAREYKKILLRISVTTSFSDCPRRLSPITAGTINTGSAKTLSSSIQPKM
jgi:cation diffusion facilitator CzcD-associated flavoprotein CzcO